MYGHFFRTIDDKKRVVVPNAFKSVLGSSFFATIGPDNVLELRDKKSFLIWKDKLLAPNMLNANARKFARIILGNTIEVDLDKQSRMLVPKPFLSLAALTKEIAFVGVGNKVEVWPKTTFVDFQNESRGKDTLDQLAKKLIADGVEI